MIEGTHVVASVHPAYRVWEIYLKDDPSESIEVCFSRAEAIRAVRRHDRTIDARRFVQPDLFNPEFDSDA